MSGQIETQSIMMKQSVLTHHNVEENLYNEPEVGFGFSPKIIEVGCHHEILAEINGHEPLKEIDYDAHAWLGLVSFVVERCYIIFFVIILDLFKSTIDSIIFNLFRNKIYNQQRNSRHCFVTK